MKNVSIKNLIETNDDLFSYKFSPINNNSDMDSQRKKENSFIFDYTHNMDRESMVNKYGIKWSSMLVRATKMGISRNYTKERKYSLDESFFDKIDTNEKAYLLGLLFADGCNSTERNTIVLNLAESDKHIFAEIQTLLNSNYPLRYRELTSKYPNRQNSFTLDICSKKISNDLKLLGVIKNKSHSTVYPKIDPIFDASFIRGVFDGDGCIYAKKDFSSPRFSIVGNFEFIQSIQRILIKELNLNETKIRRSNENKTTSELRYGGIFIVKRIYDYLYKDDKISFNRKKEKFNTIFKRYNIL